MCRPAAPQPSTSTKPGSPESTSEMVTLEQLNMIVNILTLAIMITVVMVMMLNKRPRAQEAKVASRPEAQEAKVHTAPVVSVTSTSSQTSTSPDPESALNQISQEIALLQARLMERDIARVHQESESRIEDLKSERQKYRVC